MEVSQLGIGLGMQRVQDSDFLVELERLVKPAQSRIQPGSITQHFGTSRFQLGRLPQGSLCTFPIPVIIHLDPSERQISLCHVRVESDRALCGLAGLAISLWCLRHSVCRHLTQYPGPKCPGWPVVRVQLDGLVGICKRLCKAAFV